MSPGVFVVGLSSCVEAPKRSLVAAAGVGASPMLKSGSLLVKDFSAAEA